METVFEKFLRAALALIADEAPEDYRALCAHLGEREICLEIDGQATAIRNKGGTLLVDSRVVRPSVLVISSTTAILRMADSQMSLMKAIRSNAVRLEGERDHLSAAIEGFGAFASAAIRIHSLPSLFAIYRRSLTPTPK